MSDKDIIYRQSAIDELIKMLVDCFQADEELVDAVATTIKELPPAQPEIKCIANITLTDEQIKEAFEKAKCDILAAQSEQRWIPCSERMPEDYEEVLVWFEYFRYGDYNRLYQTHGIGDYSSKYDSWMINHESGWSKLRVFAWMPLPKPWKGERNE